MNAMRDERAPITGAALTIVAVCGAVLFIDGFDTQAISYIAPVLAKQWHLSKAILGPVFSSALVGLMVGYLAVSPLSDRFGHRRVIVVSTACFGIVTLATVFAHDVRTLIALRFLTGIGLGAAAPSAIALTSERSPQHLRASFVLAIYCGFSLGFVAAGLVAGAFLGRFGWQSVLLVGALIPIAIAPIALRLLPRESATAAPDRAPAGRRVSVVELFTPERMPGTLLLWFAFLVNLGEFYFIQSWLPTILTAQSAPVGTIVTATTLSTVGGIVAAFAMGPAMDRLGAYRSVAVIFLFACAAVAGTGLTFDAGLVPLLIATFALGFFVSGGQKSVIALCALHYPADVRSAGVGWALGIGRIGGIGGPLLAGALFARHWAAGPVFYVASIPLLAAAGALFALERLSVHRVSDSSAAAAPIGAQKARAE